jgi:hypothetical protein
VKLERLVRPVSLGCAAARRACLSAICSSFGVAGVLQTAIAALLIAFNLYNALPTTQLLRLHFCVVG